MPQMFKFCGRSHTMLVTDVDDFFLSLERNRKRSTISIKLIHVLIVIRIKLVLGRAHNETHQNYCTITNDTYGDFL